MATKQEWLEYFQLVNGREPTIEEFAAARKNHEIDEISRATPTSNQEEQNIKKNKAGKKLGRKRWIISVASLVLLLAGGTGGYFAYQWYEQKRTFTTSNSVMLTKGKLMNIFSQKTKSVPYSQIQSVQLDGTAVVFGIGASDAKGYLVDKNFKEIEEVSFDPYKIKMTQVGWYDKKGDARLFASENSVGFGHKISENNYNSVPSGSTSDKPYVMSSKYYGIEGNTIYSFGIN